MISFGFPPATPMAVSLRKACFHSQNTLFCIFAVVFRTCSCFFAQLEFFYILYYAFWERGKGKTAGNFQSTGWVRGCCLSVCLTGGAGGIWTCLCVTWQSRWPDLPWTDSSSCQLCSSAVVSVPAVRRRVTKINVEPGESGMIGLLADINVMVFRGSDEDGNQMRLKGNF